jgi:hypothetical protein
MSTPTYSREQYLQMYKNLPEELKEVLISEKNDQKIGEIGDRFGISDEQYSVFSKMISYVLMGILPIKTFEKSLKDELEINNDTAQKIAQDAYRFIFFPVINSLKIFYPEMASEQQSEQQQEQEISAPTITRKTPSSFKKPLKSDDTYREPI